MININIIVATEINHGVNQTKLQLIVLRLSKVPGLFYPPTKFKVIL